MPYILEVQKFNPKWTLGSNISEHIGYMRHIFETKEQACKYYDRNNPNMRSLNAHNTWRSDWDPETHFQYIVCEQKEELLTFPPFPLVNDPIRNFISNKIVMHPERHLGKQLLNNAFKDWYQINYPGKKITKLKDLHEMMDLMFEKKLNKKGLTEWINKTIRCDCEDEDGDEDEYEDLDTF